MSRKQILTALFLALSVTGKSYAKSETTLATGTTLEVIEPEDEREKQRRSRFLHSGDKDEDLKYFHSKSDFLGVDLGTMIPFGDAANEFATGTMFGFHVQFNAIAPFGFVVGYQRSASGSKNVSAKNKLSINALNIGAIASFPMKRILPWVKVEGAFYFNDASFNDGRTITGGNDLVMTTVGLNAGIGLDFVVGREVSVGFDITYHYPIPKKLTLNDGVTTSDFNIASPFATMGIRVSF